MFKFMRILRAALLGPFVLLMGVTSSSAVLSTDFDTKRRRLDVDKEIARLVPDEEPFMSVLLQIPKRTASDVEIIWFEDRPYDIWTTLGADITTTSTTLTVADASVARVKDIIQIPATGETMRVTGVDAGANTITVTRSWGAVSAAASSSGSYVLVISNAMEENSNAPSGRMGQPTKNSNYVQEMRHPFEGSDKMRKITLETPEQERDRLTFQTMQYHKMAMARATLFGEKNYDSTLKTWTMAGLRELLTENVYNVGGALTEANFKKYVCEPLFRYDKSPALLTCSQGIFGQINDWAKDKIETTSGEETYGVRLKRLTTAYGDIYLAPSQVFEKGYAGWGFALHMKNLKWADFTPTKLERNLQENDRHGWKDEVWGEYSLEAKLPETHVPIRNVTV